MDYNEYRELTNLITVYFATGNQETLSTIHDYIETKNGCRKQLMKDLVTHTKYIRVFPDDEQVKIIRDLTTQICQDEHLAYKISWMLPYVSDKVLDRTLSAADNYALVKIMHNIKGNIEVIGHRLCDPPGYFYLPPTTTTFSRMREKMTWRRIYRKCRRNLKK